MRNSMFKKEQGFTLLEIVIAISLIVLLTTLLMTSFGPWLRFKQRLDTETRLKDLSQAATAFYKANAYKIDDQNGVSTYMPAYGVLVADPMDATKNMHSNCPAATAGNDPAEVDSNAIVSNLMPLQSYASTAISQLARDGFNTGLCVFVSKRQTRPLAGATVYYHTLAFVSPGENGVLDSITSFDPVTGTLMLGGDDKGSLVDGYQIAAENVRVTTERLQRFAKAYETYFNIRYLLKVDRDISVDYFYKDNTSNNGDPGSGAVGDPGPTIEQTIEALGGAWAASSFSNVIDTDLTKNLGISNSDGVDAWNHSILFDNRSSRVRAGKSGAAQLLPPYTAAFGALMPGASDCGGGPETTSCTAYISATAVSSY